MAATQIPATQALAAQLTTKASESKKFRMTVMGLIAIVGVFLISASTISLGGPAATILSLATVVVSAISALVVAYTGSQAAVDWKTTASLAP